jgi:hypothetical protein
MVTAPIDRGFRSGLTTLANMTVELVSLPVLSLLKKDSVAPAYTKLRGRARTFGLASALTKVIMCRLILTSSGILFMGSAGAFFLFVPPLSIAT